MSDRAKCLVCTAPVGDGAYCCATCADRLARNLGDLPALADELETSLTRQSRQGGGSVGVLSRNAETMLPWDERAATVAHALRAVLVANVRMVVDDATTARHEGPWHDRPCGHETCLAVKATLWPADTVPAMVAYLLRAMPWLRRYATVDEIASDVEQAARSARRVIDNRPARWYAGRCTSAVEGGLCDADLYAADGATFITCRACGAAYDVRQRRAQLVTAAESTLATATDISRFLTLYGERVNKETLWKWKERGVIVAHSSDPQGRPLYRIGDVLDVVARAAERRAG